MKKLSYTATLELVPLMEVPGVKQVNRDLLLLLPNKGRFSELGFFGKGGGGGGRGVGKGTSRAVWQCICFLKFN